MAHLPLTNQRAGWLVPIMETGSLKRIARADDPTSSALSIKQQEKNAREESWAGFGIEADVDACCADVEQTTDAWSVT